MLIDLGNFVLNETLGKKVPKGHGTTAFPADLEEDEQEEHQQDNDSDLKNGASTG